MLISDSCEVEKLYTYTYTYILIKQNTYLDLTVGYFIMQNYQVQ